MVKRLGWRSGSYDWYLMAARGAEMAPGFVSGV
jgi:hypothetical protein